MINCFPEEYNYRDFFYVENICCSDLIKLANAHYPGVGFITYNEVGFVGL